MHDPDDLTFRAAAHPNPTVARFGFNLDHRYLEQCWTPALGPAAVVLLRHLAARFQDRQQFRTSVTGLADELGVKPATMRRTLHRVEQYRFVSPTSSDGALDVYATIAPLTDRQLDHMPANTVMAHHQLLTEHLNNLAPPTAAAVSQRLDRLQHQPAGPGLER